MQHGEEDFWIAEQSRVFTTSKAPYIDIEQIDAIPSLDQAVGIFHSNVPDPIFSALFGQPDQQPVLQTYALLDASTVLGLVERLDSSNLEYRCLFQGDAETDLADAAPWLVQITPDSRLTKDLFTQKPEAFWHYWDVRFGILLRSAFDLDTVWKQLRRFTRVNIAHDQWVYWRFYDPVVMSRYLGGTAPHGSSRAQFFADGVISSIICRTGNQAEIFSWNGSQPPPKSPFKLQPEEQFDFRLMMYEQQAAALAKRLRQIVPNQLLHASNDALMETLSAALLRLACYGFSRPSDMETMASWDAIYGAPFEAHDPAGQLQHLCRSDAPASGRFKAMLARMDALNKGKEV